MLVYASASTFHAFPRSMFLPRRVPRKPDASGKNLMHAGSLFFAGEAQCVASIFLGFPGRSCLNRAMRTALFEPDTF